MHVLCEYAGGEEDYIAYIKENVDNNYQEATHFRDKVKSSLPRNREMVK